jgi:hypothetical protein
MPGRLPVPPLREAAIVVAHRQRSYRQRREEKVVRNLFSRSFSNTFPLVKVPHTLSGPFRQRKGVRNLQMGHQRQHAPAVHRRRVDGRGRLLLYASFERLKVIASPLAGAVDLRRTVIRRQLRSRSSPACQWLPSQLRRRSAPLADEMTLRERQTRRGSRLRPAPATGTRQCRRLSRKRGRRSKENPPSTREDGHSPPLLGRVSQTAKGWARGNWRVEAVRCLSTRVPVRDASNSRAGE